MRIALGAEVASVTLEAAQLSMGQDLEAGDFTPLDRALGSSWTIDRAGCSWTARASRPRRCAFGTPEGAWISVQGTRLRGEVVVLRGVKALQVVNVLPLEDYLAGVLGSEMPKSFPLEALKAQAIAARTYALNKKLEQLAQPFYGLGVSQVYRGLEADDERTRAAIAATQGLVLTYQLQPIEADLSRPSCGGHTESGREALGRDLPYLTSVERPCGKLATSHWSLALSQRELKALSGAPGASQVKVQGRSPTGRARRVEIGARELDAATFRGSPRVRRRSPSPFR